MAFEQRDNSGSVFKNTRKQNPNHPDRTGSALIDGVAYWVNGWIKQDRNGNQYLSLAFKRKDQPAQTKPVARRSSAEIGRTDMGDEVPW